MNYLINDPNSIEPLKTIVDNMLHNHQNHSLERKKKKKCLRIVKHTKNFWLLQQPQMMILAFMVLLMASSCFAIVQYDFDGDAILAKGNSPTQQRYVSEIEMKVLELI